MSGSEVDSHDKQQAETPGPDEPREFHRGDTFRFRLTDRRKKPTPMFSRYTFLGKRIANRRGYDGGGYYVDRVGTLYLMYLLVIVALSLMDAVLTVACLNVGLAEANPVMASVLGVSPLFFVVVKFILTAVGAVILILHKNFKYVNLIIVTVIISFLLVNLNNMWLLLKRL